MTNKTIGYIRTSKNSQNLGVEVQKDALMRYKIDALYIEQVSGRKENRKELINALKILNQGDTLVIYKIDRLGRSTKQLVNIISELEEKQINLISIKESIDTSTSMGKVIFTILSAIAELEADYISERTKDALAVLKENGVKLGNKGLKPETIEEIKDLFMNTKMTQKEIAKKCNVCLKTIYNVKTKYNLIRK
ncbi:recombinase family protein [Enterococcus thailandicus]|uniref:DNA invertase n=1 Tax=Enterococcus thailandicus TaxID=417368 RepID=A0A510WEJ5_ENTTH|nr:recombinase family protein [Enterococcus thailandicus]MDA3964537.1 recombinase family protein [Enterococcus thailandicus]MDT2845415.1 recombinase family protein [Enterococcus thailandicus]OJG94154.1 resolvase [Enterococcus thailandicus]GEK37599.1 DNA invertase [Enterococcus thailandicus]GMC01112.1 recombinase family protein [Enterococcus thailandicus]